VGGKGRPKSTDRSVCATEPWRNPRGLAGLKPGAYTKSNPRCWPEGAALHELEKNKNAGRETEDYTGRECGGRGGDGSF
jgi:hypothetical protein